MAHISKETNSKMVTVICILQTVEAKI